MEHELMQFFRYAHLPQHLQAASRSFGVVAEAFDVLDAADIVRGEEFEQLVARLGEGVKALPDNLERAEALRKLRDLRSVVHEYPNGEGGASKTCALRLLLEAKDCAVRAVLYRAP